MPPAVRIGALLALLAALLAACGGGGEGVTREEILASCEKLGSLASYRYSITVQQPAGAGPATDAASPEPPGGTPAPLAGFQERFRELLSDYSIRGAFVSPDRSQVTLEFHEEEAVELRSIGGRVWERFGDVWNETQAVDIEALMPRRLCDYVLPDLAEQLAGTRGAEEVVNGELTRRYSARRSTLQLPGILWSGGAEGGFSQFDVAVWLADDGRWPAKLEITGQEAAAPGAPAGVRVAMELSNVNDETIVVEAPPAAPTGD